MPKFDNTARTLYGHSIMFFPMYRSSVCSFFAIGKVLRIAKGEEADLVYIDCYPRGKGNGTAIIKTIVVGGNMPRRQLLTIKRGQYAMFYGSAMQKTGEKTFTKKNGETVNTKVWAFYAYACQGWYVPTSFDVKKAHKDKVDEELFTEMSESEEKLLNNIIDDLMKNRGEEDE